jgi:hypothetical protein
VLLGKGNGGLEALVAGFHHLRPHNEGLRGVDGMVDVAHFAEPRKVVEIPFVVLRALHGGRGSLTFRRPPGVNSISRNRGKVAEKVGKTESAGRGIRLMVFPYASQRARNERVRHSSRQIRRTPVRPGA